MVGAVGPITGFSSTPAYGVVFPGKSREPRPAEAEESRATGSAEGVGDGLTEAEQREVDKLRARDAEVRRHEQAHAGRGGQYAGAPQYEYTTGPDGKQYATSGEVSIDVAPVEGDPEATVDKMRQVISAALAPAEPSGQDAAAAPQATLIQAQAEVASGEGEGEEKPGAAQVAEAYGATSRAATKG
ncbi:MAG: hypothetical protein FJX47_04870 [Alphaproteobacteria bacterium]|nr:hypothetical protein [Alphaproteobacteria bacterium]